MNIIFINICLTNFAINVWIGDSNGNISSIFENNTICSVRTDSNFLVWIYLTDKGYLKMFIYRKHLNPIFLNLKFIHLRCSSSALLHLQQRNVAQQGQDRLSQDFKLKKFIFAVKYLQEFHGKNMRRNPVLCHPRYELFHNLAPISLNFKHVWNRLRRFLYH